MCHSKRKEETDINIKRTTRNAASDYKEVIKMPQFQHVPGSTQRTGPIRQQKKQVVLILPGDDFQGFRLGGNGQTWQMASFPWPRHNELP